MGLIELLKIHRKQKKEIFFIGLKLERNWLKYYFKYYKGDKKK